MGSRKTCTINQKEPCKRWNRDVKRTKKEVNYVVEVFERKKKIKEKRDTRFKWLMLSFVIYFIITIIIIILTYMNGYLGNVVNICMGGVCLLFIILILKFMIDDYNKK